MMRRRAMAARVLWCWALAMVTLPAVVAPLRLSDTIVGHRLSGGPAAPVTHLTVPAGQSSLLSTVQSSVSFGGRAPPTAVTGAPHAVTDAPHAVTGAPHAAAPELVTAVAAETALLDLPQSAPTVAGADFDHSAPVRTFFGPEDAVTARRRTRPTRAPPAARAPAGRRHGTPQYRRVIAPVAAALPAAKPTAATQTATVSVSLQCPQGHALWPATSRCVPIGEQGPCLEGSVIHVHVSNSTEVTCACLPRHLEWSDGRCFLRFTSGPCGEGGVICESEVGPAECRCRSGYHRGRDGVCYRDYSRADCPPNNAFIQGQCVAKGPCPESFFMVLDAVAQRYSCGCPPGTLLVVAVNRCIRARTRCRECVENLYSWPPDGRYYRELTRGPCNTTELLINTDGALTCGCGKYAADGRLAAFLEPTARWPLDGRCYRLYERAICRPGHWFIWSSADDRMPVCCPRGHFFWPADGRCYQEFTHGPCAKSELFVSLLRNSVCTCDDQWGFTVLNPEDGTCYLRNTQGPCRPGFRFLGSSRSGGQMCDCLPGEFYHEPSDNCYPLYQRGPCRPGQWLVFAAMAGRAVCRDSQCPEVRLSAAPGRLPNARLLDLPTLRPLVYWKVTDRCYQIGSRGPCGTGFRLELDEYGISPLCQSVHQTNREEPVQAPLNEVTRCPPGSYRAISRSCLPVLVTTMEPDASAVCGELQVWSEEESRCQPSSSDEVASCPASYHPYPEGGECVCPLGQYPDEDGSCTATQHHGPGPLHWTIHNYLQMVERDQHQQKVARSL